jgi:uncharacterized membrane protein required for colicin V production
MVGVLATLSFGANWYDLLIVAALIYGVWNGVRTGLSGEIIRVIGLVLMVLLALSFYIPVGKWLQQRTQWAEEPANLAAFLGIAIGVYLISVIARVTAHRWMKKLSFTAAVENVGGGAAGLLRMAVIMAWVSVGLSLTRSEFWHHEVAHESKFGSYVVEQFPAVAAVVEKQFPEKMWFLQKLKRRAEPTADEAGAEKKP